MQKKCTKCNLIKENEEFHSRNGGLYNTHAECKICMRERSKRWKKNWDENQKQKRRDQDNLRRKYIKSLCDKARDLGDETLDFDQFCEYKKKCSEFIKRKCRLFLNTAIQNGWLIKPKECFECKKEGVIHGHHYDYLDPLSVIWLCPKCHHERARKQRIGWLKE